MREEVIVNKYLTGLWNRTAPVGADYISARGQLRYLQGFHIPPPGKGAYIMRPYSHTPDFLVGADALMPPPLPGRCAARVDQEIDPYKVHSNAPISFHRGCLWFAHNILYLSL